MIQGGNRPVKLGSYQIDEFGFQPSPEIFPNRLTGIYGQIAGICVKLRSTCSNRRLREGSRADAHLLKQENSHGSA